MQGPRLGRIEQVLCLQQKMEKAGWGRQIAVIGKANAYRGLTRMDADQEEAELTVETR
jgi:hypothetical protein